MWTDFNNSFNFEFLDKLRNTVK